MTPNFVFATSNLNFATGKFDLDTPANCTFSSLKMIYLISGSGKVQKNVPEQEFYF